MADEPDRNPLEQLQAENAALRARVSQLEGALRQAQSARLDAESKAMRPGPTRVLDLEAPDKFSRPHQRRRR